LRESEEFIRLQLTQRNQIHLPRRFRRAREDRLNLAERVTLNDGVGEQAFGKRMQVFFFEPPMQDEALAGRRMFDALNAQHLRAAHNLFRDRVGDAGAERNFKNDG